MTQIYIKQNIHKHQTQNFRRISPFSITPVEKAHKARTRWYRGPFRRFINTSKRGNHEQIWSLSRWGPIATSQYRRCGIGADASAATAKIWNRKYRGPLPAVRCGGGCDAQRRCGVLLPLHGAMHAAAAQGILLHALDC